MSSPGADVVWGRYAALPEELRAHIYEFVLKERQILSHQLLERIAQTDFRIWIGVRRFGLGFEKSVDVCRSIDEAIELWGALHELNICDDRVIRFANSSRDCLYQTLERFVLPFDTSDEIGRIVDRCAELEDSVSRAKKKYRRTTAFKGNSN